MHHYAPLIPTQIAFVFLDLTNTSCYIRFFLLPTARKLFLLFYIPCQQAESLSQKKKQLYCQVFQYEAK